MLTKHELLPLDFIVSRNVALVNLLHFLLVCDSSCHELVCEIRRILSTQASNWLFYEHRESVAYTLKGDCVHWAILGD